MVRRLVLPLLVVTLSGCAVPRLQQRQALVLDPASEARFDVTYGEPADCLWRQRWPVRYEADRSRYRLIIAPALRFGDEPAEMRVELHGAGVRVEARGAELEPERDEDPATARYRLRAAPAGAVSLEVYAAEERLATEEFTVRVRQCRAWMWR